ncbi:MAG: zinc ribbon domain-containing protein, partial [Clostridia bacterium]|nr:zinc ribbon domain-containing protein [Clostridia bacterium]
MQTCPHCGNSFEGNFCPECGVLRQESRNCPACGAELNAVVKYCPSCGVALTGEQPKPAEQVAQSSRTPILSSAAKLKLFSLMGFVPPILLFLFGGLVFAFLAAPVVKVRSTLLGIAGQLNGYEILTEAAIELETLTSYIHVATALGALSIPAAFLLFYFAVVYPKAKINYKNLAVYAAYLIAVVLGAYIIGYIKEEDGGLNMLTAGEFPALLIGFASGFAALSLVSLAVRFAVVVQFGGFSEFDAARKKRFDELLEKIPLTEETQTVPKPSF